MSASGQKRTLTRGQPMSAIPPIPDIAGRRSDVRFVPKADIVNIGNDQLMLFLERVERRRK
jgi:hypothetical protein